MTLNLKFIASPANPLIKQVLKLKKNKVRQKEKKIIIEGQREISLARQAGLGFDILFYCPTFGLNKQSFKLFLTKNKINYLLVRELKASLFQKISYRQNPDGLLAISRSPIRQQLKNLKFSAPPLLIILEKIEKPGNLGAIVRTARAAKIDAIILAKTQVNLYNPNVIRASQGNVFLQPIITVPAPEIIAWLKENNIRLFAATAKGNVQYTNINWRRPAAIALGEESQGLTTIWRQKADKQIKIPCAQPVGSLNVSVAAGIIIYEALRQRKT